MVIFAGTYYPQLTKQGYFWVSVYQKAWKIGGKNPNILKKKELKYNKRTFQKFEGVDLSWGNYVIECKLAG